MLELAQVAEVVRRRTGPRSRAQPSASPNRPCATHTRALSAGTGRTLGKKSLTYRRSASSSRSSAPSRSPSASRTRAIATRQRYGFCGSPACSPSSWLRSKCCVAAGRSFRSRWISLIPTYMSAVPRSTDPPCSDATLQGLLVGAHRLAEPALRDAGYPPARSRTRGRRRRARPAAAPPCIRHTPGAPASRSPLAQDASPSSPAADAAPEVVVLRRKLERPPGVPHGAGHVAPSQGQRGAVHLDRPREAAELLVVDDDHLRRRGLRVPRGTGRRVQPPLGVPQPGLDALELAASQQRPGIPDAEHGPDPDQLVGKRLEPATQRGLLPAPAHGRDRQLDQVRRPLEVLGGQRVADRLGRLAVLLVPRARPPVQLRNVGRAARPAGAPAARRRRGGGSDTTGGGRRAGPGTGSPAPAPPAWPCRRPGR